MKLLCFLVAALAVNLLLFASIFEIYFTSPLVHGMTPHTPPLPAPARRLVLFVADGLRADAFFQVDARGSSRTPFLRDVIERRGSWGISHTRVPTESRPGHVALIAGFYEDVAAVAKGWQENPVEFDSVFNESRYTWSWGSPDILPMFAKGATGDHVYTFTYTAQKQDFAADSSKLDTWVFDNVKDFLQEARRDSHLGSKLANDRVMLFLHLLGIDISGHAHRPASQQYLQNIGAVDEGVAEIVAAIEEYFENDGKTAYLFTSDHGMTDWGSHGAGHSSETMTPVVCWGGGVNGPEHISVQTYTDSFSEEWKLNHLKRKDVNQADLAPLMATLLGIPFPMNSVGLLPLSYLNTSLAFRAEAALANALAIVEQFQVKRDIKRETALPFFYTPYQPLHDGKLLQLIVAAKKSFEKSRYDDVVRISEELVKLSLGGLRYYHTYDRAFIGTSVVFGFVGWMVYIATLILRPNVHQPSWLKTRLRLTAVNSVSLAGMSVAATLVVSTLLALKSSPFSHYAYCFLPIASWAAAVRRLPERHELLELGKRFRWRSIAAPTVLLFLGIELLVLSFFHRETLSAGLLALAAWPYTSQICYNQKIISLTWSASCLFLSIFPLLPTVGRVANISLVVLAAGLTLLLSSCALKVLQRSSTSLYLPPPPYALYAAQMCLVAVSACIVYNTHLSLERREGLPLLNQLLSWTLLGFSLLLPLLSPTLLCQRLFSICLSLTSAYLLLTTSHEALFLLVFTCVLLAWIFMESQVQRPMPSEQVLAVDFHRNSATLERNLSPDDVRRAYIFVYFIVTAFFGTGNIASINSFDPSSVYCFVTVFSPFVMGALMMWKILIPFVLVMCAFEAIRTLTLLSCKSLFLIVLLHTDFMAIHFFFMVQDHGSWLDIGVSISHFVIIMSTTIFLLLLSAVAHVFTKTVFPLPRWHDKHL
uniref:GPI ethanolamine phosphate transferase 1 n=1 Tax=Eptatretus burgeri TaxID=7764 RepID=A0A8C4QST0_EPTBU